MILNLNDMPDDSLEALLWLSGVREQAAKELDLAFQGAYFQARSEGRLPAAMDLKLHSRKRVMAFTRHENEARGRVVANWGDGLR